MLSYFRNVKEFKKYLMQGFNLFGLTKNIKKNIFLFLSEREGREGRRKWRHYCYSWLWVRRVWFILLSAKESGKLLKAEQNNINRFWLLSTWYYVGKKATHSHDNIILVSVRYEEKEMLAWNSVQPFSQPEKK